MANNDAITASYTSAAAIAVLTNDAAGTGAKDATTVFLSSSTGTPTTSRTYTDANGIVFTADPTAGTITFTNPNKFVGVTTVGYNFGNTPFTATSNTGVLTLTLTNTAPVAVADNGGATANNAALNNIVVVTNDTDVNGFGTIDATTVTLVGAQVGGVFVANANGTVNFTPTAGSTTTATVNYTVRDELGATSNQATLSVTVRPAPVAANDAVTAPYNSATAINVLNNDVAGNGNGNRDVATVFLSADTGTPTTSRTYTDANGIVFTANATTGTITFTNPNKFVGVTTVGYNFKTSIGPATSNTGVLTLTLTNATPVAVADNGGTTITTASVNNINVLGNDTDTNGAATIDKASVTLVGAQTGGTFTVNMAAGANQGTINFTPTLGFFGPASVNYTVQDEVGAISNQVKLSVTVTGLADVATSITPTPSGTVNAGEALSFAVTFANAGPSTASGFSRTLSLTPGLGAGSVTIVGAAGLTGTYNNGTGAVAFNQNPVTLASGADLNVTVSIVPVAQSSVTATTTIATSTSQGADAGANTATSTVAVAASVACQPSFLDNANGVSGLTAEYYATDILENGILGPLDNRIVQFNRVPGVRRNDSQANFPTNTSFNTNGSIIPPATLVNATDGPDQFSARYRGSIYLAAGDYTFRMLADDAAFLWLGPAALTPTPLAANATIQQTVYTNAGKTGNFTAPTSGLYDLQVLLSEGAGGNNLTLSYASGLNQPNAPANFALVPNYVLCAGPASANAAPVAVAATNAALSSSAAATVLSPGLSGTDADGSLAYFHLVSLPANGALSVDLLGNGTRTAAVLGQGLTAVQKATLAYKPSGTFTGTDAFLFAVTDNLGRTSGASAFAPPATAAGVTYSIPVSNSAPVVANITNVTLPNTSPAVALNPGVSATDADGSVVSYTVTGPASSGTLRYNGTPVTGALSIAAANIGQLTYQPAAGATVQATFTFTATDNSGLTSGSATYTIPVINPADLSTVLRGTTTPGGAQTLQAPQGGLIFFEATTTNNGPGQATNTVLKINLPIGLTGVSLSNSGTYNSTTGVATFAFVDLNAGQSFSRNIAFTMLGTTVNGSATAVSNVQDQDNSNNTGTAFINPTQVADVIVAINGPTRVLTNEAVLYTVVPTNLGPSTATGVTLRAQLPKALNNVIVSNAGVYNSTSGVVTWGTIGTLANGASVAYTVRFNAPSATGTILAPAATYSAAASATSTTADGDPVSANNNGTNGAALITTQVVSQAATLLCITPSTTDVSLSNGGFNTYYPGLGTVAAGSTSLTVGTASTRGAGTPLASGDLVLIMQMQGSDLNTANTDSYGDGLGGDAVGSGNVLNANFTAGVYEYNLVSSYNAATGAITLNQGLGFGYSNADAVTGTNPSGQRRYQVIRVPLYRDVTLLNDVSAPRWDGLTGGVLAMDANGTLNFNGHKIDMAGRGFRGAAAQVLGGDGRVLDTDYRHSNTLTTSANKGEGTAGTPRFLYDDDYFAAYKAGGTGAPATPVLDTRTTNTVRTALLPAALTDGYPSGDRARGAPGNAGGGGTDGNPGGNDENTGGGGGSNAGRGGVGGNAWNSNKARGGFGGADFTQSTASRIIMGGGGGAGTTNNGTVADPNTYSANQGIVDGSGFTSSGAAGGGVVLIRATSVGASAGTIDVSGASMPFVPRNDASGGGGAGGSVLVLCNASNGNASSPVLQNLTILSRGGNGGSNTGGGAPHGPGGGGAGGVAFTSSAISATSNLVPGANGLTFGFAEYGSGVGSAALGQVQSGITRSDVPNVISACAADVVTTLSTNSASQNPGQPVALTVTTVNNGPGSAFAVVQTVRLTPLLPITSVFINGAGPTSTSGNVGTYAGATYDQSTGVVTFAAVATLAPGSLPSTNVLTNIITLTMPNATLQGVAASTSQGDLDPRAANNDGSLAPARVSITAINALAGTIFDDVNYGGGAGRNLSTADASAVNSGFVSGAIGSAGTRVELYSGNTFYGATTTGADGIYGFASVPVGSYTVRVVNNTVKSVRDNNATGVLPVQTFRRTTVGGALADDANRVGGESPAQVDGIANNGTGSVQLNFTGLNSSGGDNTAFIDQVEIVDVVTGNVVSSGAAPANPGFETPALAANTAQYAPAGAIWAFQAQSGLDGSGIANGTGFDAPAAPQGAQVAFVQGVGNINQTLTLPVGTYQVRFRTAQRNSGSTNDQTLSVRIGADVPASEIGSVQPANNGAFATYQTGTFTVAGFTLDAIVAQSKATVTVGAAAVTNVDFGYNFSTIVNKENGGQGSLRQFITNANALPNGKLDQTASSNGGDDPAATVEKSLFMIADGQAHPGLLASANGGPATQLSSGVAVIIPTAALPALTDANTSLDGTTQTLNIGNTNNPTPLGTGGTVGVGADGLLGTADDVALATLNGPEVQLQGTPTQAGSEVGLSLENTGETVRGFSIYGFGNSGGSGTGNATGANIRVTSAAVSGTLITGNVIGSAATAFADPGSAGRRSTGNGILLTASVVSAQITNNLIGYNGASGIENFANATPTSVTIQGNEIRTNAILAPASDGVRMGTFGGRLLNNLIINNEGSGVDLAGSYGQVTISGNTIQGNGVGGIETAGVRAFGQGNTVSLNLVSSNNGDGILVRPGTNAANTSGSTVISRNSISTNGQLGINLLTNGENESTGAAASRVTLNDLNDADGHSIPASAIGGNGLLNFPVILQAVINGPNLLVKGYARPSAIIELYGVGATANATGFGEGVKFLKSMVEGNTVAANGTVDTNSQTGSYSGLINGRNQGSDNTNLFTVSIPLSSLPSGVVVGSVLSATATFAAVGTSEFSGNVTVGGGPLPVELTDFEAEAVQNIDAHLTWHTASEKNNDHFDVERSLDGTAFVQAAQVKGQGTVSAPTAYTLTDKGIGAKVSGNVYYRLRQVDTDGTATYSPVRTVAFTKAAAPAIGLFPNPATAATQLDLRQLPAGTYQVSILDAVGRVVLSAALDAGRAHPLDLNTIASGTYTVLVRGQNNGQPLILTKRLVKE